MGLKVNLSHCFKQIARSQPMHGAVLVEFERNLRETIRGEHSLQELAEVYCLTEPSPFIEGAITDAYEAGYRPR